MKQPKIERIFHPSDFSAASEMAFEHALKIALVTHAALDVLHVDRDYQADWADFPRVRATLERWRLIPAGSPKSAVPALGIDVSKVISSSDKPVRACLDFLTQHPADLIVLAVRQHAGRMRWLEDRVGAPIARKAGEMTLFFPDGVRGFVSAEDGSVSLRNILIPVAAQPSAEAAVAAVPRIVDGLGLASGTVTLLHVGVMADAPSIRVPDDAALDAAAWRWNWLVVEGEPTDVIVQTAQSRNTDLIVMTTEGPHGFLDALRGSTSEQVLRSTPCPVLSLPSDGRSQ